MVCGFVGLLDIECSGGIDPGQQPMVGPGFMGPWWEGGAGGIFTCLRWGPVILAWGGGKDGRPGRGTLRCVSRFGGRVPGKEVCGVGAGWGACAWYRVIIYNLERGLACYFNRGLGWILLYKCGA